MIVLCLFCLELLVCVALGWPIVAALLVGLVLFVGWALRQGYGLRAVGGMLWSGIRTAKNVLIVFLLIGVLTALWRACGTVPLLICYAVDLIHPGTLVITSFLLASAVSALMGTSFGAAATMGAVCMTAAASMGVSPVLAGGAVLSGVFFGDRCSPVSTSALLNGGGIVSMLRVTAIVCISAAYSGIFQATGLLGTAKEGIARMSRRITPFGAMFCTAVAASMIACNQTLSILLTHQLCADTEPDGPSCAIDLENSVVVLAPLVPWSIAGAVPLASAGAPEQSLLAACYLYLIPLCSLAWKLLRRRRVTA